MFLAIFFYTTYESMTEVPAAKPQLGRLVARLSSLVGINRICPEAALVQAHLRHHQTF